MYLHTFYIIIYDIAQTQLSANFLKHTNKNPLQKFLIENFYTSLIALAKPLKPQTILDVGCGEGFSLNKLVINGVGKRFEGLDSSKEAISLGKSLFPNLILKPGSIYDLPYNNRSFDLIICLEVLEHLENPQKALSEILRVSKNYAILSVPNEPFFMISNLLRGKNIKRLGNDVGHINHWNSFSFKKFIKEQRLSLKQTKLPFPWILVLVEK